MRPPAGPAAGVPGVIERAFLRRMKAAGPTIAPRSPRGRQRVDALLPHPLERALVIRRGAFYPQPEVDSAVVLLKPRATPVPETPVFRALVRGAFQQRRKKLRNAWEQASGGDRERLAAAATRANIDLDARGETLGVADFARMAAELAT